MTDVERHDLVMHFIEEFRANIKRVLAPLDPSYDYALVIYYDTPEGEAKSALKICGWSDDVDAVAALLVLAGEKVTATAEALKKTQTALVQ